MKKKIVVNVSNLDSDESIFFGRELEHIKEQTYDVLYPEYTATRTIPVTSEAGSGADSITYRQFDRVGLMKVIANYADDLPRSDVKGKEYTVNVRSLGGSFGYNVQEVRAAMKAGRPLSAMKANSVRQAYEHAVNQIAYKANPANPKFNGLQGLFYNPNVTKANNPSGKAWADCTPDEIIADVTFMINRPTELTQGVEVVNTVLLPISQYGHIAGTPRSSTSDTTILEFLKRVFPNVSFESIPECSNVKPKPSDPTGNESANIAIAYNKRPDKLTLELPQLFEQFPPQERGLEIVVPCHARVAGVIIYYPLSVIIMEGI